MSPLWSPLPAVCGERAPGEAQGSRAGEGLSPRTVRAERAPRPSPLPAKSGAREKPSLPVRALLRLAHVALQPQKLLADRARRLALALAGQRGPPDAERHA